MKNYYRILGIKPDSSPEQIDATYERLLDLQEKYPAAFVEDRKLDVDEAYDVLSDPDRRKLYDEKRLPDADREQQDYYPSSGLRLSTWLMPHSNSVPDRTPRVSKLLEKIALTFGVSLLTLIGGWFAANFPSLSQSSMRAPHPVITVTEGGVSSPQAVDLNVTPITGQQCLVRAKSGEPVQLLLAADVDAVVLDTIDPDTAFFGIWHDQWFEFDDSILGLPQHGFVWQADIVVITCY